MMRLPKIFPSILLTLVLCMGLTQINAAIWDPLVNYFMSAEKWLSKHMALIQSNNSSPALEDKIKEARVVILLEGHSDSPQLVEKNIQLIHKFWKKGDLLLAEGGVWADSSGRSRRYPKLKTSLVEIARNCGLPVSTLHRDLLEQLVILIESADHLLSFLFLSAFDSELDEEFQQIHSVLSTEPLRVIKISELNIQESKKIIEELAFNAVRRLKEVTCQLKNLENEEFLDRQTHLVHQIEAALKETDGVVWVLAEETRGRYLTGGTEKTGVQYLYDTLENSAVSYVTIAYRLNPGQPRTEEEIQGLLNDPSLIPQREAQAKLLDENIERNWQKELQVFSQRYGGVDRATALIWIGQVTDSVERQTILERSRFLQFSLKTMLGLP